MKTNTINTAAVANVSNTVAISDNSTINARLAEIAANVHAENTTSAYQSDIALFRSWLDANNKESNEIAVLEYLTELSTETETHKGCKESTLRRKYISLRRVVTINNPALFRTFFKGLSKTLKHEGKNLKQARAMHKDNVIDMCGTLGDSAKDIRNKALFLLAYYGAFRSSEICGLRWSDITEIDKGLKIHIDGKTGAMDKFIAFKAVNCPVRALVEWHRINNANEFVFVKVGKGDVLSHQALTRHGFNKIIKSFNDDYAINFIKWQSVFLVIRPCGTGYANTAANL